MTTDKDLRDFAEFIRPLHPSATIEQILTEMAERSAEDINYINGLVREAVTNKRDIESYPLPVMEAYTALSELLGQEGYVLRVIEGDHFDQRYKTISIVPIRLNDVEPAPIYATFIIPKDEERLATRDELFQAFIDKYGYINFSIHSEQWYGFELGINTRLLGPNTQITDVGQILGAFSKTKSLNNLLERTTTEPSDYRGIQFGEKKFYQPLTPDEVTNKLPDKFVPPPTPDWVNTFFRGI